MELDDTLPRDVPNIKCCVCGIIIPSNPSNMCINCVRANVDIGESLTKEYTVIYCPECERYLQPPKFWTRAELESRELMVICLKKIRGLSKFNLTDASFIWTEPHSKRLKLKLVLQKEVFANTVIQQSMVIDYVVHWQQCDRCARAATGQPQWDSCVQLRQKAEHRRTFLYLEQLILKHRMHEDCTKIDNQPDGLDFYFGHKSHALSFVDFINGSVPVRRIDANQLVSHDSKSNTAIEHHTFSLEIAPICREDLVCLPPKLRASLGGVGPLVLVHKIYSSIVFVDPKTLRASEIMGTIYWKNKFQSLATTKQLKEFYVLDVEPTGVMNGKFRLAQVTVCRSDEVGSGDEYVVDTHLGHLLKPGDYAMGYDLAHLNHNNEDIDRYDPQNLPDVILVRKHYPSQKRRRSKRKWTLKKLEVGMEGVGNTKTATAEEDEAEFMDDIERDPEFRSDFHLYKEDKKRRVRRQLDADGVERVDDEEEEVEEDESVASDDDDEERVDVDLAELLDELKLEEDDDTGMVQRTDLPPRKRDRANLKSQVDDDYE